ncbi:hypothetical protein M5C99_08895 [Acidovorax sp. NCPPB 2350]|nr:hypothetical protein M5C99_08895 [Acidovorax sp. NCPPB 2350]
MSRNANPRAPGPKPSPMTPAAAARIQSRTAKGRAGKVPADSFAARAQRAAARNPGGAAKTDAS